MSYANEQNSSPLPEHKSPRRARLLLAFLVLLIVATNLVLFLAATPQEKMVWLSASEFAKTMRPGPLTQLKHKFLRLTAPIWQHFTKSGPRILIEAKFLSVSPAALAAVEPNGQGLTNSDGARAWILSSADLAAWQQQLKSSPGVSNLASPRILTADGVQAQVQTTESISGTGQLIPVGFIIDVSPKIASGSVRLTSAAIATERMPSAPEAVSAIRTNLTVACRALVPSAGGLVIAGGKPHDKGTSYWLVVSPTLVDAQGQPIKQ